MTDEDIEATKAPLIEHLMELRERLIRAQFTTRQLDSAQATVARLHDAPQPRAGRRAR